MPISPDMFQSVPPEQVLAEWEREARRFETPCGDGKMIWRFWGEGPPVLLLHGAHGSWTHWIYTIPHLAPTRTVVVPDLPGYGDSSVPRIMDQGESFAEAIAEGLHILLKDKVPLDVVGFSLGGVLATHLAGITPSLVRRVILVGTGGLDTPLGEMPTRSLRGLTDHDDLMAAHRQNLLAIMVHWPENIDPLALAIQAENVPKAKLSPHPLVMPDHLLRALPRTNVPIDAIWGEFDRPHPDPWLQRDVLKKYRQDLEFRVVPNAGHWVMYENAKAFNQYLDELLAMRSEKPVDAI